MENLTKEGMAEGIRTSVHVILFLSAEVLTRPFVLFEIATALAAQKRVLLVHESDARHGAFD